MQENMFNALSLLLIGMITVFAILSIIVLAGRILIYFVNKSSTAEESIETNNLVAKIPNTHIAVLTAVTEHLTEGRGKIEKIEKL